MLVELGVVEQRFQAVLKCEFTRVPQLAGTPQASRLRRLPNGPRFGPSPVSLSRDITLERRTGDGLATRQPVRARPDDHRSTRDSSTHPRSSARSAGTRATLRSWRSL
jgi:hypothetical protein